jgi:hypothetical protein
MAQINKVRLPDGRTVRPTEWSSTPLWSSVEIGTGNQQTLSAFSYSQGQEVPGALTNRKAQLCDTNFRGDGAVLAENEELLIYSVMVECFAKAVTIADYFTNEDGATPNPPHVGPQNMLRFQQDVMLVMAIANTKDYLQHPVGFFPAAMGVNIVMSDAVNNTDAAAVMMGHNGCVNTYDNRKLATPHRVGPGEAFTIDFEFPQGSIRNLNFGDDGANGARLVARVYADGYRRRPVA